MTRFIPDPRQVFALIGQRHPGIDFSARRRGAQAALDAIGKPYVLHDIYRQMAAAGLAAADARALLAEELAVEQAMMLPVRAAIEQVGPGDLLISDMYLPGEVIAALLAEICALHGALPVIRSNWGKHGGTIWPKILKHYVIRTHYGDNPNSDFSVPRQFGIDTVLRRDIDLTGWEKQLAQLGLIQLALIHRETRLRSLRHGAGLYEQLAAGPYVSLLLGYAGFLAARFGDGASLAFLSRDGDDMGRVFRALFPAIRSCNLDLSRRLAQDPAHDDFFREALPDDVILVDGISTGRSVSALLDRLGRNGQGFQVLLFLDHLLDAKAIAAAPLDACFRSTGFGGRHHALELLLHAPYPPVTGMEADTESGGLIRRFAQAELTEAESRLIRAKCEIVTTFLRTIRQRSLPPLTDAQNQALMRNALEAILTSALVPTSFPSFAAREKFGSA